MRRCEICTITLEHTTAGARRVRGANDPDAGVVVAAVPPDMHRSYALTWEMLAAFGKQADISGAGRHEDLNWELVATWALAHAVTDIVLVDAQWIPERVFSDIVGLASVTGARLWLVAHHPVDDGYTRALAGWPTAQARDAELARLLTDVEAPLGDQEPPDFPRLPADSYLTFRAEARRRLSSRDFELVDSRYTDAYRSAATWFDAQLTSEISEASVLGHVRRRLNECASSEEMLVEVRGLQAAAHNANWLVSADVTRLAATAQNAAAAAVRSPHTWRRLRAYREPYRGAVCALVACELALEALESITLGDVHDGGSTVAVVRTGVPERVAVPKGAELFLRAQVIHRRIQGALPADLLFATEKGPMRKKFMADAIRAAATEIGVPLYSQQVERAEIDPNRWARRWGLAVQAL